MSIATSIEKLSETLTNCKANLKEKEVADVDNIKISDVDEKIAEIQAGGGIDMSQSWFKDKCIILFETNTQYCYDEVDSLEPQALFQFYQYNPLSPATSHSIVFAIYNTQEQTQTINLTGTNHDGEDSNWSCKFENVDLSKPGIFHYMADIEWY